jgi:hypothetical protein
MDGQGRHVIWKPRTGKPAILCAALKTSYKREFNAAIRLPGKQLWPARTWWLFDGSRFLCDRERFRQHPFSCSQVVFLLYYMGVGLDLNLGPHLSVRVFHSIVFAHFLNGSTKTICAQRLA